MNGIPFEMPGEMPVSELIKLLLSKAVVVESEIDPDITEFLVQDACYVAVGPCSCDSLDMNDLEYLVKTTDEDAWDLRCSRCLSEELLFHLVNSRYITKQRLINMFNGVKRCRCTKKTCVYKLIEKDISELEMSSIHFNIDAELEVISRL